MGRIAKSDREKAQVKSANHNSKMMKAIAAYCAVELRPDGKRKTLRDLAIEYQVGHSALGCRVKNGAIGIAEFNKSKQKLAEPIELELEAWCLDLADRNLAVTNALLQEKANRILFAQNPNAEGVGHNWVNRFLIRHGEKLRHHWSRPLDRIRATSSTQAAVDAYFQQYISIVGEDGSKIDPKLQFAFDETGIQPSMFHSERVIGSSVPGAFTPVASGTDRQLTTFVPVISAANQFVTGLMIFPTKHMQTSYLGIEGNPHGLL